MWSPGAPTSALPRSTKRRIEGADAMESELCGAGVMPITYIMVGVSIGIHSHTMALPIATVYYPQPHSVLSIATQSCYPQPLSGTTHSHMMVLLTGIQWHYLQTATQWYYPQPHSATTHSHTHTDTILGLASGALS